MLLITSELKEDIIALIRRLPDDSTIDDMMYHLYVKKKIAKGIKDIKEGNAIPHEVVMKDAKMRLEKGLE